MTQRDRPVTEEELREWEAWCNDVQPLTAFGVNEQTLRRLIAAVREAQAEISGFLKKDHELTKQYNQMHELYIDACAKLAEIRAVVKEHDGYGGLDPQYMLLRRLHEVIGE